MAPHAEVLGTPGRSGALAKADKFASGSAHGRFKNFMAL